MNPYRFSKLVHSTIRCQVELKLSVSFLIGGNLLVKVVRNLIAIWLYKDFHKFKFCASSVVKVLTSFYSKVQQGVFVANGIYHHGIKVTRNKLQV